MARPSGNDLLIAKSGQGEPLILTREQRSRHLYVTGSTGSGKSKFLEHLIRQDIMNWRKSECGLLLLDPHGAIYDGIMSWHARTSYIYDDRPVIPIDLRCDDSVVAYNLLRPREQVVASVVTDNLVDACAYMWGSGSTDATPRLARNMATVFQTLTNTDSPSRRSSRSSILAAMNSARSLHEAPRTRRPAAIFCA
jgi:hypothetical protein